MVKLHTRSGCCVWHLFLWRRNQRGIVLATALILMMLLAGISASALYSSYLNSVTTTNLKMATRAQAAAEAGVNEALYRLSWQEGQPGALAPDLTQAFWNDPNLQIQINFTSGDNTFTDGNVSTIIPSADWPTHIPPQPVVIRYKKPNPATPNVVLLYDRTVTPTPFTTSTLPAAPGTIPHTSHAVYQVTATGLDDRGAERQVLAEVTSAPYFAPPAPLSSGISVNLGGSAFSDGVNHSHLIHITNASGSTAMYGDGITGGASGETTNSYSGTVSLDSPDDNNGAATGADGIANHGTGDPVSGWIPLSAAPGWTAAPRLFNKQVSTTDTTPAWVGLSRITNPAALGCTAAPWNHPNVDHWHGTNTNYAPAVALSTAPLLLGVPGTPGVVKQTGLFSWRMSSDITSYAAAAGSSCEGATSLMCRPPYLQPFPDFQTFLGLDDVSYLRMLDTPDRCGGTAFSSCPASKLLGSSKPPLMSGHIC